MLGLARVSHGAVYSRAWKQFTLRDHLYLAVWAVSLCVMCPAMPDCPLHGTFARTLFADPVYATLSALLVLLVFRTRPSGSDGKSIHALVAGLCIAGTATYASGVSCGGVRLFCALSSAAAVPFSFVLFALSHHGLIGATVEAEAALALLVLCAGNVYVSADEFARNGRAKDAVVFAAGLACSGLSTAAAAVAAAGAEEAEAEAAERLPLLEGGGVGC